MKFINKMKYRGSINSGYISMQLGYIFLYGSILGLFTDRNRPWYLYLFLIAIGVKMQITKYINLGSYNKKLLIADVICMLFTLIISMIFIFIFKDYIYCLKLVYIPPFLWLLIINRKLI